MLLESAIVNSLKMQVEFYRLRKSGGCWLKMFFFFFFWSVFGGQIFFFLLSFVTVSFQNKASFDCLCSVCIFMFKEGNKLTSVCISEPKAIPHYP